MQDIVELFPELTPAVVKDDLVIYTFYEKYSWLNSTGVPDNTIDVVVKEKTVSIRVLQKRTGENMYSKKTWTKWENPTNIIYSLKQERYGKPILRIYNDSKFRKVRRRVFCNTTPLEVTELLERVKYLDRTGHVTINHQVNSTAAKALVYLHCKLTGEEFSEEKFRNPQTYLNMAYPATRMFPEVEKFQDHLTVSSPIWCKEPEVKLFIKQNFGSKAVRKDMVKAVASMTDSRSAVTAFYFAKHVPPEWLIPLFLEPEKYALTSIKWAYLKGGSATMKKAFDKLLKLASVSQRKRLLLQKNTTAFVPLDFNDSINLILQIRDDFLARNVAAVRFDNWKELHNSLAALHRKMDLEEVPIPQEGFVGELDGKEFSTEDESYIIRSPKTTADLLEWGNTLNNCIATYGKRVANRYTNVFAVYKKTNNMLYANLEYNNGRIIQFVESYNRGVPTTVHDKFFEVVKEVEKKISDEEEAKRKKRLAAADRRNGRQLAVH